MIIVTGIPRSRTSLTMQILDALRIDFIGDKFLNKEVLGKYNKYGLYEKNEDVVYGYKGDNEVNKAIKIMFSGLFPNHTNGYKGTPNKILRESHKLICMRNPYDVCVSIKKIKPSQPLNPQYYVLEFGMFLIWLKDNYWFLNNTVVVNTDNYLTDGTNEVRDIAKFLGVILNVDQANKIANDVIKSKDTTRNDKMWPESVRDMGKIADQMFTNFVRADEEGITKAVSIAHSFVKI